MSKSIYYQDSNIKFEYEMCADFVAIHCAVTVWNKSVLRNAYFVFGEFMNMTTDLGITKIVTLSPNPKFAKLFGGKAVKSFPYEGKNIEVIVWELS